MWAGISTSRPCRGPSPPPGPTDLARPAYFGRQPSPTLVVKTEGLARRRYGLAEAPVPAGSLWRWFSRGEICAAPPSSSVFPPSPPGGFPRGQGPPTPAFVGAARTRVSQRAPPGPALG